MKKSIIHIIYSIAVMAVATLAIIGCADRGLREHAAEGFLRIEGLGILVEESVEPLMTKAAGHVLEVIVRDDQAKEVAHYPSHLNMPLTTPLKAGTYTVTARSADRLTGARFDIPQYEASKTFTIEPARIESVDLLCTETTCSVTIAYDDLFRQTFDAENYRYYAILTSSISDQIRVESTDSRAAYFKIPTPDINIFCQVFMERKNSSGGWDRIWGAASEGLKEMVFTVNPEGETAKMATRYNLVIKI